jgi:hypothetical protein
MQKTYKILIALVCIFSSQQISAQNLNTNKYSFYSEVIPYSILYGSKADGFQVGIGRHLGASKYKILITYGVNKLTYELSDQVAPGTVNGVPIVDKTTDASIFTPNNWREGGIPDQSLYELLEGVGIKHYEPRDGAYVTNYGTLEIIRSHSLKNKWNFEWGLGTQMGLMNRNEVGGGLSDSVNYFGVPIKTWIIFRISARYLYYGITSRISLTRNISDHFSIGISSGIHLIMAKNSTDTVKPYFGVLALCRI